MGSACILLKFWKYGTGDHFRTRPDVGQFSILVTRLGVDVNSYN